MAAGWILTDTLLQVSGIVATLLISHRFSGIGNWSEPQILFMAAYSTMVAGVVDMMFGMNVSHISRRVGRGQMDHVLVQPQPVWMALLTEGFLPFSGSGTFIAGAAMLAAAQSQLGLPVDLRWFGLFAANIAASAAVIMSFSFAWASLAFWSPRGAEEISSSAMGLMRGLRVFPLDGVGTGLIGVLSTAVPVAFIGWYPASALLGMRTGASQWGAVWAAMAALFIAASLFGLGMRKYREVGSRRYDGWGHRS